MQRETGILYTVLSMSCPYVTGSVAESCSDLDTQHSVGQELHGLPGLGPLTAVTCLEYNEINFCEDVSVTANQCVI